MSICFLALETSKVFYELIIKELEDKGFDGLTSSLVSIFPYLKEDDEISISKLAKKVGYTRQAMHKNLKKLEILGYINTVSALNKKEKLVVLSSKGESLIMEANAYVENIQNEVEKRLGKEDLESYKKSQEMIFELLNSKVTNEN